MNMMSSVETTARAVVSKNHMTPIPKKIPKDFKPKLIVHAILTIDRTTLSKTHPFDLRFSVGAPKDAPPALGQDHLETIRTYAQKVADARGLHNEITVTSPYDIPVEHQCWVLLELRGDLKNWYFTPQERGCTTKAKRRGKTRNCALHHVYANEPMGLPGEVVTKDGCHVLFFGVVRRGAKGTSDPDNPSADAFNIHVEFKQTDMITVDGVAMKVEKRLQVIFDPDVKNDGTKNFPPPPPPPPVIAKLVEVGAAVPV